MGGRSNKRAQNEVYRMSTSTSEHEAEEQGDDAEGDASAAVDVDRHRSVRCCCARGAVLLNGEGLECLEVVRPTLDGVGGEHHALSAMTGLSTVRPDGCSLCEERTSVIKNNLIVAAKMTHVVDLDSERREGGSVRGNGHEARVEADLASGRSVCELAAGLREVRLGHCVVLDLELEGDRVAGLRGDVRGVERDDAITADDDLVVLAGAGRWLSRARVGAVGGGESLSAVVYCDGRGDGDSASCRRGGGGGGCGRVLACSSGLEGGELVTRVDCEDHSLLAVTCLFTEHPVWVGRVDGQDANWEVGCLGSCDGNTGRETRQRKCKFTRKSELTIQS